MPNRPRIVLLGRQGSGKGTQSARLAAHLGVPHVSTGDLFRTAVRDGTALGRKVADILAGGGLVPDDMVIEVVREHAARHDLDAGGYILDGFPRTVAQAEAYFGTDADLTGAGHRPDAAVELDIPADLVLARLAARRVCPVDGWTTTVEDPATEGVRCPDGHLAVQRPDDTPEAIGRRLELYEAETGPLGPWFAAHGLLARVDGTGDPGVVFQRILDELEPFLDRSPATTS